MCRGKTWAFNFEKDLQRNFDLSLSFRRIHSAGAVLESWVVFFCFLLGYLWIESVQRHAS